MQSDGRHLLKSLGVCGGLERNSSGRVNLELSMGGNW